MQMQLKQQAFLFYKYNFTYNSIFSPPDTLSEHKKISILQAALELRLTISVEKCHHKFVTEPGGHLRCYYDKIFCTETAAFLGFSRLEKTFPFSCSKYT